MTKIHFVGSSEWLDWVEETGIGTRPSTGLGTELAMFLADANEELSTHL